MRSIWVQRNSPAAPHEHSILTWAIVRSRDYQGKAGDQMEGLVELDINILGNTLLESHHFVTHSEKQVGSPPQKKLQLLTYRLLFREMSLNFICLENPSGVASVTCRRPKRFSRWSTSSLSIEVVEGSISSEIWEMRQIFGLSCPNPKRWTFQVLDSRRLRCCIFSANGTRDSPQ